MFPRSIVELQLRNELKSLIAEINVVIEDRTFSTLPGCLLCPYFLYARHKTNER